VAGNAEAAGDPRQAGAYCPFPEKLEKGRVPECFTPVQREYPDFLAAVDSGRLEDSDVAQLERQLESPGTDGDGVLAVSSLAYGYFRLAERAAASEHPDPTLVARLQRWNELLSAVYEDPETQPGFRTAVRAAAEDLHRRAPAVAAECEPGSGDASCQTTGVLLLTLRRIDDPDGERGVRGALGKLLGRMLGEDEPPLLKPVGGPAGDPIGDRPE
jgi:hypothetical protein